MYYVKPESAKIYSLILIFLVLLFFPSFFYIFRDATSTALGLAVALPIVCALSASQWRLSYSALTNVGFYFIIIAVFMFIYGSMAILIGGYGTDVKTLYSAVLLFGMMFSSCFISIVCINLSNRVFVKPVLFVSVLSIILGLFSIVFDQSFLGYELYAKSVFPFAEPSHYAIAVGPVLFASGFFIRIKFRVILVLFSLFFSLVTPSLIMFLFAMLMAAFFFKWNVLKLFLVSLCFLIFILFFLNTEQGGYFVDRLSFFEGSRNLTALVYMQGWEDMLIALQDSRWLGIGFQNLGTLPPGNYGEIIHSLAGEYKNRNDGGFLASKIVAELGVLGVLFIFIYLFFFIKSSFFLMRLVGGSTVSSYPAAFVFSNAIIVSFFIELFARGSGYFTPGLFLYFMSLYFVSIFRWKHGKKVSF